MAYEVRVVDVFGTSFGTLTDAKVGEYSHELNAAGSADVTLAANNAGLALLQRGREIQIWEGGTLRWWGPLVKRRRGLNETKWECAGTLWYFGRRFMGKADRTNLLTNGNYEAGEANWTFANGVTHTLDTGIKAEGAQSLKLTGATTDHLQYAGQTSPAYTQAHPLGDYLTASTWVYVPSASYVSGAVDDRGLVAIRRNSAGTPIDLQVATIDDSTEKDMWIPLEVGVPAMKTGDTLEVRLYPPHGVAYYDLVTLTAMESLSFGWPNGVDLADIVDGIVLYAQDNYPGFIHGKSDLNIGTSTPATGVILSRHYQFAEHREILDALLEFVRMGVIDIDIAITPTTRTVNIYAPTKGSLYGTTLTLGTADTPGNLKDFTDSWDGDAAGSDVVVTGAGDGPDRPEGGASDPGALGGLTLEIVESASDEATVGELDIRAAERLALAANPVILEVTTMPGAGIIGTLQVGDTVPVHIVNGTEPDIDGVYRVVRIIVDPNTDQASLTLNAVP
jgi:hypothetical protein